jgi:hypothetical protein
LAGCCECGDEPSGSGATELVSCLKNINNNNNNNDNDSNNNNNKTLWKLKLQNSLGANDIFMLIFSNFKTKLGCSIQPC